MPRGRPAKQAVEVQATVVEDRPSKVDRLGEARPKRVPIHGYRNIIGVSGLKPGFHGCWVNEDNVERFLDGGYDYVTYDVKVGDRSIKAAAQIGGKISKAVGNGVTAYLMECPEDVYKDELDRIHKEIDQSEAGMRENLNSGRDGQYGKVKIGRSVEDAL